MHTYQLYVGADNLTGILDLPMIKTIMEKRHQGFTINPVTGYWQGQEERSAVITVSSEDVSDTVIDLKQRLGQDAIGVLTLPAMTFV